MKIAAALLLLLCLIPTLGFGGTWFETTLTEYSGDSPTYHYPVTVFIDNGKLKADITRIAGEKAALLYDSGAGTLHLIRYQRNDYMYWDADMLSRAHGAVKGAVNVLSEMVSGWFGDDNGVQVVSESETLRRIGNTNVKGEPCVRYEWVVDDTRKQLIDVTPNMPADDLKTLMNAVVFSQQLLQIPGLDLLGFSPPDIRVEGLLRIHKFPMILISYINDRTLYKITSTPPRSMNMRDAMFHVPSQFRHALY
ncbi:MAG: hypothetical protein EOL87_00870 [Spartobacteria bacterium]|nr:hypothetical protein [Spartobacteria bacterium]